MTPEQMRKKLRAFVRMKQPGGCKVISMGTNCECPLCCIDGLWNLVLLGRMDNDTVTRLSKKVLDQNDEYLELETRLIKRRKK